MNNNRITGLIFEVWNETHSPNSNEKKTVLVILIIHIPLSMIWLERSGLLILGALNRNVSLNYDSMACKHLDLSNIPRLPDRN